MAIKILKLKMLSLFGLWRLQGRHNLVKSSTWNEYPVCSDLLEKNKISKQKF